MAQQAVIPTTTIATSNSALETVKIFTFYNRNYVDCVSPPYWTDVPYIKECFLAQTSGFKNGISFVEGELLITAENYPSLINFWIDSNGHFFVKGNDASNYSIDSNGHLIYTFC